MSFGPIKIYIATWSPSRPSFAREIYFAAKVTLGNSSAAHFNAFAS
jgi:hypothetical protein